MKRLLTILLTAQVAVAIDSATVIKHAKVIGTITEVANTVGVSSELMLAIAWVESSYRTRGVTHQDGTSPSYGLFQIKLETAQYVDKVYKHKHLATPSKLSDPYMNTFYACKYMKLLIKQYNGDEIAAIDSYNKGHLVSHKSQYVRKVLLARRVK